MHRSGETARPRRTLRALLVGVLPAALLAVAPAVASATPPEKGTTYRGVVTKPDPNSPGGQFRIPVAFRVSRDGRTAGPIVSGDPPSSNACAEGPLGAPRPTTAGISRRGRFALTARLFVADGSAGTQDLGTARMSGRFLPGGRFEGTYENRTTAKICQVTRRFVAVADSVVPVKPHPNPHPRMRFGTGADYRYAGALWAHAPDAFGYQATVKLSRAKVVDAKRGGFVAQELWVATNGGTDPLGKYKGGYIVAGRTQGCGGKNVVNDFIAQQEADGSYNERCHSPLTKARSELPLAIAWRDFTPHWGVYMAYQGPILYDGTGPKNQADHTGSAFVGLESSSTANRASGSVKDMRWLPYADPREGGGIPFQYWSKADGSNHSQLAFDHGSSVDWKKTYFSFDNRYSDDRPATTKPPPKDRSRLPRYVALGDSFSSGEGAHDYYRAAPGRPEKCHRSRNAYAPTVARQLRSRFRFAERRDFLACSGAKIPHHAGTPGLLDQIDRMGDKNIGAVTVGIGGNDAGFTPIVAKCVVGQLGGKNCDRIIQDAFAKSLPRLSGNLDTAYAAIRRRAPSAKVVVLGYPSIFDDRTDRRFCKKTVLTRGARMNLAAAADRLDALIADRARVYGFQFVDPRAAFLPHRLCGTGKDWLNGIVRRSLRESFHPNEDGQSAFARLLRAPAGSPLH